MARVDVVGALAGQALPQGVVGEQAGDARRQVGGVRSDERGLALDEVEALGPDRGGDDRGVGHHRLDDLALDTGAVAQGDDGEPGALQVGPDRGHPPHQVDGGAGRVDVQADLVEPAAEHGEWMALEQLPVHERQHLVAQVLDGLAVGEVAEVADEHHPPAGVDRVRRPRHVLDERQGERLLAQEVVEQVALLVRNRQQGVGLVVRVQLARCRAAVRAVEGGAPGVRAAGVAQEVEVDGVQEDPGGGRVPANHRDQPGGRLPVRDQREVDVGRAQDPFRPGEAGVGVDPHAAQPVGVAPLDRLGLLAGEERHAPAGIEQEPDGVVDEQGPSVAVDGGHPDVRDERVPPHPRQASTSSWARRWRHAPSPSSGGRAGRRSSTRCHADASSGMEGSPPSPSTRTAATSGW